MKFLKFILLFMISFIFIKYLDCAEIYKQGQEMNFRHQSPDGWVIHAGASNGSQSVLEVEYVNKKTGIPIRESQKIYIHRTVKKISVIGPVVVHFANYPVPSDASKIKVLAGNIIKDKIGSEEHLKNQ